MHRSFFRFISALLLFFLLSGTVFADEGKKEAEAKRSYEAAKSSWTGVTKKDPEVRDLMEWERAASRLLSFARDYDLSGLKTQALFDLGRLYETTWRKRRFQTGLSRALYFYEQVSKEAKGSELAADALLALGDLRRSEAKDETGARAAYFEITDNYKNSKAYKKAWEKLGAAGAAKTEEGKKTAAPAEPAVKDQPDPEEKEQKAIEFAQSEKIEGGGKAVYSSASPVKRPVIVIDPGHGGKEEGAHGVDGTFEKDITLNIAMLVDEMLRERLRAQTLLTRARDIDLPLAERTKIANDHNADLFISIHTNASEYKTATGIETYYLDNTDDKSSLKLAERENASVARESSGDLGFMVSDLIQNAKQPDSIALAHKIQESLHKTLGRYYKGVKDLGVKKAPFYVLVGAHMPCILVEVSFIDHPVEGPRLVSRRYQKLVALSLYEGIRAYFEGR